MRILPNAIVIRPSEMQTSAMETIKLRALSWTNGPSIAPQILKRIFQSRINNTIRNELIYMDISDKVTRRSSQETTCFQDQYDVTLCIKKRPHNLFTSDFFSLFCYGKPK